MEHAADIRVQTRGVSWDIEDCLLASLKVRYSRRGSKYMVDLPAKAYPQHLQMRSLEPTLAATLAAV